MIKTSTLSHLFHHVENREPLLNDPQTNPSLQSRHASIAVPETVVSVEPEVEVKKTRKKGKGALLLDERTELTADELKARLQNDHGGSQS
jgi:hypothetical protein